MGNRTVQTYWAMEEPRVVPAAGKTIALLAPPTQPSHAINKVLRETELSKTITVPQGRIGMEGLI